MLMNFKTKMLSTEIEYDQEIWNIFKKISNKFKNRMLTMEIEYYQKIWNI